MISASQDERATDDCLLEFQVTQAWLYMNTQPVVECLVAQSESLMPYS